MKKRVIGLSIIIAIIIFFSVEFIYAISCDIVQMEYRSSCQGNIVMALSSETGAHGEFPDAADYPYALCCDFGTEDIDCIDVGGDGISDNAIIRLSSPTNAHAEVLSQNNYLTDVCYEDLECISTSESCFDTLYPITDILYPIEMISLSDSTNAHIGGIDDYDLKICCRSQEYGCALTNVKITPKCGTGGNCGTGDSIDIDVDVTGDCSFVDYIQVDASGPGCNIAYSDEPSDTIDIVGLNFSKLISSENFFSASWQIPEIPDTCLSDLILGTSVGLYYKGPPGTGTWVTGTSEPNDIGGSFSFVGIGECDDGTKNVGEDCYNCKSDAGCMGDEICYISEEKGECQPYNPDNPPGGCLTEEDGGTDECDTGESCDCSDCESKQSSCIVGRVCSALPDNGGFIYKCACNNEVVDDICPDGCLDDPDCEGECGNTFLDQGEECELTDIETNTWTECDDPKKECTKKSTVFTGNTCDCFTPPENGWILYYTKGECIITPGKREGKHDITFVAKCIFGDGCSGGSYDDYTIPPNPEDPDGKYPNLHEETLDQSTEKCTAPPEKVPFFTNLNILFVAVILIGYYLHKKKD